MIIKIVHGDGKFRYIESDIIDVDHMNCDLTRESEVRRLESAANSISSLLSERFYHEIEKHAEVYYLDCFIITYQEEVSKPDHLRDKVILTQQLVMNGEIYFLSESGKTVDTFRSHNIQWGDIPVPPIKQ
jgi:hypothetical protein